jgi:uncharacterized protein (DUF608 family)
MRYCLLFVGLFLFNISSNAQSPDKIHQLRIYEIFKDNKEAFHQRFKDHATRIMKKCNFNIIAIWESQKENKVEFVYLLEWKNETAMKDAWAKFMADKEWADIKKQTSAKHGKLVGEIQDRVLVAQDYSPRKSF